LKDRPNNEFLLYLHGELNEAEKGAPPVASSDDAVDEWLADIARAIDEGKARTEDGIKEYLIALGVPVRHLTSAVIGECLSEMRRVGMVTADRLDSPTFAPTDLIKPGSVRASK